MADAPKAQRRRRRRRVTVSSNNDISSAAPTADATPSGVSVVTTGRSRPRRRRRPRVVRINRPLIENEVFTGRRRFSRRPLTRAIKREIKREGLDGPKVSVQQKITSTFGMIGPNTTGNTELELNFFLHPALAKEANDGTAFGPLQALAAQYSLWKIKYLSLRFTPLVGASAVSGTVIRASLNLSQSPGGSNWSGLGTRLHLDMHPGQVTTFHLRGDQVGGPRDGGWWFTDTNEEGSQSAGPIVEVHTLGQTKSTFQAEDWKGPLFIVEGIGLWQFANYQVKPALGTLERREGEAEVNMEISAGQPIAMTMESNEAIAMFMDSLEPESAASYDRATPSGPSVGETIFQIVDVGAKLAESFAPPPFSWLIKGGWWFVKKVIGRTRSTTSRYVLYASLQDAQNNKPAIAMQSITQGANARTRLLVTQVNSPNVGPNPNVTASTRMGPQLLKPGDTFRVSSPVLTELFLRFPKQSGLPVTVPVSAIPGVYRSASGDVVSYNNLPNVSSSTAGFIQTPWWIGLPGQAPTYTSSGNNSTYIPSATRGGYIHSLYRLLNPRFTDRSGSVEYFFPEVQENALNFCAMNSFCSCVNQTGDTPDPCPPTTPTATTGTGQLSTTNPYAQYGKVVGSWKFHSGTVPPLDVILTLIKITNQYSIDSDCVRDLVVVYGDTGNSARFVFLPRFPVPTQNPPPSWNILERDIPVDSYLLGVSYTNQSGLLNGVNIPTLIAMTSYSRVESALAPIVPYDLSGQMFPSTSVDVQMEYSDYHPPTDDLIKQLRQLGVPFTMASQSVQESGLSGPCSAGEDVMEEEPKLEISDEEDGGSSVSDDDGSDSVEQFILDIGNEMISLPKRWLNDPGFSKYLE